MKQTNELTRLLSTIKLYDKSVAGLPTSEYDQCLELLEVLRLKISRNTLLFYRCTQKKDQIECTPTP